MKLEEFWPRWRRRFPGAPHPPIRQWDNLVYFMKVKLSIVWGQSSLMVKLKCILRSFASFSHWVSGCLGTCGGGSRISQMGRGANSKVGSANPLLLPANEVCEGYVFTIVCLSTGGLYPGEVSVQGRSLSRGSPYPGEVSVWGVSVWGGSLLDRLPLR